MTESLIETLFIVFWVVGLLFFYSPVAVNRPWAPHVYYMLMFALTGLALFAGHGAVLR